MADVERKRSAGSSAHAAHAAPPPTESSARAARPDADITAVFAAIPGAAVLFAADAPRFTLHAVSEHLARTTQRPAAELVGRPLAEVFPARDEDEDAAGGLADLRGSLEAAVRSGERQRMERQRYDLQLPDGRWDERYWDALNSPVKDRDGVVRWVLHTTEDVTDTVRSARALAAAERRVERILERIGDAHVALDRDFRIVSLNRAAERVFGIEHGDLIGRSYWEAFPASIGGEVERQYRRVHAERVEAHFTHRHVGEGHDLHLEVDAYPSADGGIAIFWRDVTARRAVEIENAYHAAVIRSSGEAMFGVTLDGIVRSWNPAAERLLGWTAEEMIGASIKRLAPPELLDEQQGILRAVREGRTVSHETTRLAKGARPLDVILTTGPVLDASGTVVGLSAVMVDISARRRGERALEHERARLMDVFRQAPVSVAVLRGTVARDLVFELVNPRYEEMLPAGRAPLGRTLGDALPEVASAMGGVLQQVIDTGEPFVAHDYCVPLDRDADGTPEDYFFSFVYHPLIEQDGSVNGIVGVGTEVTESVRARRDAERARERAERLQHLTAALAGARTMEDVANVAVADMVVALGARTGVLAGRAPEGDALLLLRTVGFPEDVTTTGRREPLGFRSPLVECYRTQAPVWLETRRGRDGLDERFPPVAPLWDTLGVGSAVFVPLAAAGETIGVISFAFTGSRTFAPTEREFFLALGQQAALAMERARLFDAERQARAEAERANRAKSDFLAVMSHELRTPLNAIGGYAELLEMGIRGSVTAQQREDLRRIRTSQRHLLGLINEVLNYAKLETGTVSFDVADVRLDEALGGAEALVAPQARAKSHTLVVHPCPPELTVRADIEKLRQVLVNLLSNAVKFTERGGRVEVEAVADGEVVAVHVRDTGIGIARDQLERIFEPFVQVRADLTRPHEGTGLGLAISRDLARGMGGDLAAESEEGKGSTFTITLPRVPGS